MTAPAVQCPACGGTWGSIATRSCRGYRETAHPEVATVPYPATFSTSWPLHRLILDQVLDTEGRTTSTLAELTHQPYWTVQMIVRELDSRGLIVRGDGGWWRAPLEQYVKTDEPGSDEHRHGQPDHRSLLVSIRADGWVDVDACGRCYPGPELVAQHLERAALRVRNGQ